MACSNLIFLLCELGAAWRLGGCLVSANSVRPSAFSPENREARQHVVMPAGLRFGELLKPQPRSLRVTAAYYSYQTRITSFRRALRSFASGTHSSRLPVRRPSPAYTTRDRRGHRSAGGAIPSRRSPIFERRAEMHYPHTMYGSSESLCRQEDLRPRRLSEGLAALPWAQFRPRTSHKNMTTNARKASSVIAPTPIVRADRRCGEGFPTRLRKNVRQRAASG